MQRLNRRHWLAMAGAPLLAMGQPESALAASMVPRKLNFPSDHGAHPSTQTEWWYLTGYAITPAQQLFGFQLTFFRSRVPSAADMQGRLAPRQLMFAHAALTDVAAQTQFHDQRIARALGTPLTKAEPARYAHASVVDMNVYIGPSASLRRKRNGDYAARLASEAFSIDLTCSPSQALLLQGQNGYSQKGPDPVNASFYTTHPQLAVKGDISVGGKRLQITSGKAWLDHEWSNALLPEAAVGWDWAGMNLHDGSALTVFRLRNEAGEAVWSGGSWRPANAASTVNFNSSDVQWTPLKHWRSPTTKAKYPVQWRVDTPAGRFTVKALVNNQELDSRQSTGTVYWEGLSELFASDGSDKRLGLGYLEMTGYAGRLRL